MVKQKYPYEPFDYYYPLTNVIDKYNKLWDDELSEPSEDLCDCKMSCFKPNVSSQKGKQYTMGNADPKTSK